MKRYIQFEACLSVIPSDGNRLSSDQDASVMGHSEVVKIKVLPNLLDFVELASLAEVECSSSDISKVRVSAITAMCSGQDSIVSNDGSTTGQATKVFKLDLIRPFFQASNITATNDSIIVFRKRIGPQLLPGMVIL